MASFDITSILDFQPPSYICPACRGLIWTPDKWDMATRKINWVCAVCEVEYVLDKGYEGVTVRQQFTNEGLVISHKDLFAHATVLAKLVRNSRATRLHEAWPTMRLFFEAISRAQYFVHFSSWGMSHIMIGALKLASMRVPVYGFVSNVESHVRTELTEFPTEAPNLHAKVVASERAAFDAPHQKIVIIDGLLAFKGSTNLTNAGMRRADRGLDLSEVTTEYSQVTELNNKFFAPVWRRLTAPDATYVFEGPPF